MKFYQWLGVDTQFDPNHNLVTSPILSPLLLASARISFALYTLFTLLFVLIWESVKEGTADSFFSYFTDLSYIGLCAYFWASGVQTLAYALGNRKGYPLQRWPRILKSLHILLYSTITTFPIIVTVVFWALLASSDTFGTTMSSWRNISWHALNTVFALFEILFTHAGPLPWSHLPFMIILLAGYLGVAYITYATQGFYTYSFLNPQKVHGYLAAYIAGIGVGEAIIFIIVRYVCVLREKLSSKRTRSVPSSSETIDEWEELERPTTPVRS